METKAVLKDEWKAIHQLMVVITPLLIVVIGSLIAIFPDRMEGADGFWMLGILSVAFLFSLWGIRPGKRRAQALEDLKRDGKSFEGEVVELKNPPYLHGVILRTKWADSRRAFVAIVRYTDESGEVHEVPSGYTFYAHHKALPEHLSAMVFVGRNGELETEIHLGNE
ncbi:MAG: hypothetical protein FWF59_04345 [Turicibacter sp.]|nr:hypothetical protein [Turicibacter sp.]